jgi:hypothetical protein
MCVCGTFSPLLRGSKEVSSGLLSSLLVSFPHPLPQSSLNLWTQTVRMIDYDSSLNPKEIHDLLKHVCNQHVDFRTFAHPIVSPLSLVGLEPSQHTPDNQNSEMIAAWEYFHLLSSKEKFYKIFQCLNENNFKITFLSLLNAIKLSSPYCVTNGTFICLQSHLETLHSSSLRVLSEPNKYEKLKVQDNLKFFEFDKNVLWNPERSEWLLNNICLRTSFASLFLQTNFQSTAIPSNICLIGSSSLVLDDAGNLQREVESVLADQYRYLVSSPTPPNTHSFSSISSQCNILHQQRSTVTSIRAQKKLPKRLNILTVAHLLHASVSQLLLQSKFNHIC